MKANIKAKWVDALRSGEYRQGTGTLYDPKINAYCCLGVLCDLAVKDGIVPLNLDPEKGLASFGEEHENSILPQAVCDWAQVEPNPNMDFVVGEDGDDYEDRVDIATINDDHGLLFNEIADLIQEQL